MSLLEYDYKKKKVPRQWNNSEATYRTKGDFKTDKKTGITGYASSEKENKSQDTYLYNSMSVGNAFSDISFGVNKKKEFAISMSEKKKLNGPTISNKEKEVKGSAAHTDRLGYGNVKTNLSKQGQGAIVYKGNISMMSSKIVNKLSNYSDTTGNVTMDVASPALSLRRDEKKLEVLTRISRNKLEQRQKNDHIEQEKEKLVYRINKKKNDKKQLETNINKAMEKSNKILHELNDNLLKQNIITMQNSDALQDSNEDNTKDSNNTDINDMGDENKKNKKRSK